MTLIHVKVSEIQQEAEGILSFWLKKRGLFKLPRYEPGAHIDVHCGDGIIRQYSLCGDPTDRRSFEIAVKLGDPSRGGSDLMHKAIRVGDNLEIGGPRNNFPLDEGASHVVLLAAGIGITPIISMADRLQLLDKSFELHYFNRSSEHTAFMSRLQLGQYSDKVSFHQGLDVEATTERLQEILRGPADGSHVYICGPAPFMDTAEEIAEVCWLKSQIHLERFASNPSLAVAPTHPFTIHLKRSGVSLDITADQTILEVLDENGIDAAFSCEQGVCGTCVTDVIDGLPEHRDSFLSAKQKESGKQMCICVSRSAGSNLTIDL